VFEEAGEGGEGRLLWKLSSDSSGLRATSLPPTMRWRVTGSLASLVPELADNEPQITSRAFCR
jgi:hypothetical protein